MIHAELIQLSTLLAKVIDSQLRHYAPESPSCLRAISISDELAGDRKAEKIRQDERDKLAREAAAPAPQRVPLPAGVSWPPAPVNYDAAPAQPVPEPAVKSAAFFKIQALVLFMEDQHFAEAEVDLLQHYAERIVIDRKEAA